MTNNENLVQYSGRSRKEVEEINRKGGQASGKARRRKAEFRKTLNALLTAEIDNPEWKPFLESIGLDCTLESAMLAAQIREAMQGNTKAAYFVAQYAGQNGAAEEDIRNKEADTELRWYLGKPTTHRAAAAMKRSKARQWEAFLPTTKKFRKKARTSTS